MIEIALETAGGALLLQRAQRCAIGLLVDDPSLAPACHDALVALVEGRLTPVAAK